MVYQLMSGSKPYPSRPHRALNGLSAHVFWPLKAPSYRGSDDGDPCPTRPKHEGETP